MKNLKTHKSFFVWLIIWLSFLSIWTFAAVTGAWTIWSLFELISIDDWDDVIGEYRLSWDNIKNDSIDSSEVEDDSLTASDLAIDSVWNDELINVPTVATLYATNRIWIWTTNPIEKLHIVGTGYPTIEIESTDSQGGDLYLKSSLGSYQMYMEGADLRFYDKDTDRVTFKLGGNVWIWTTSPSQKLDVVWHAEINGQILWTQKISFDQGSNFRIDTNASWLVFDGWDGTADFLVYDERIYADNITMWYWWTALLSTYDWNEHLIIDPSGVGSVGIATTPGWSFTNGKAIALWDGDTGIRQDGDGELELWTNNAERLHVNSTRIYAPWVMRADWWFEVDAKTMIASNGTWHSAKYTDNTHYGYFEGRRSDWTRWFYLGRGNGWDTVNLTLDNASILYVNWTIKASSFIYTSDEKLKKNIKTLNNSLENINKLRWVNFDWKGNNDKDIGLIAQEVEKVYPDLVVTDDDWMKAVKYGNIVAILVEWVKELYNKVVWNTEKISDLEHQLEELKTEMRELKNVLENN